MNCPNCGSPVTVQGNHWECSWCGDFGDFLPLHTPEQAVPNQGDNTALKDLERGVLSILEGIQEYFGNGEEAEQLACRLAVYGCPMRCSQQRSKPSVMAFSSSHFSKTILSAQRKRCCALPTPEGRPLKRNFCSPKSSSDLSGPLCCPSCHAMRHANPGPTGFFQTVDGLSQIACFFFRRGQPGPVGCPSERLEFPLARLSHSPARSRCAGGRSPSVGFLRK